MAQTETLKVVLQSEGAAIAGLACLAYAQTDMGWVVFALLILAPDLTMLGYLAGNRVGAICYNIGHSYLGPCALGLLGWALGPQVLWPVGLIWTAHIGLDRAIGYGLKYRHHFKATHLQNI